MQSMAAQVEPPRTGSQASWCPLDRDAAIRALGATGDRLAELRQAARELCDAGKGRTVTYSRKAFFPITNLCRDRCAYCTFRRDPGEDGAWTMRPAEVRAWAERAKGLDCREALMCLGDKPEAVFADYRALLSELGHTTTIGYVGEACSIALEAGLLPHSNPGIMTAADLDFLKPLNVSLGLMLESVSPRLRTKGHAHYYAPDKEPSLRIQVLHDAGERRIPFTTGLLIGIGESLADRVDTLAVIADLHRRFGHVQEVIVQNFRSKPEIPMATCAEPDVLDLARTVAVARLMLGPEMNIQIPPNLSPDGVQFLLDSGINDFGGISPLTPDYVNPEAPWPHTRALARSCAAAGYRLVERLPIYPEFVDRPGFLDAGLRARVETAREELAARDGRVEETADAN